MGTKRVFWGFLLVGLLMGLMGVDSLAAGKVKDTGMLTSIEEDGSVIIDEKGYDVDSKVEVLDSSGVKVSLNRLSLPTKVDFEYEYMKGVPVIKRIREIPKIVPR